MSSCLIIAGEKSGEEHAMSFFPELKRLCPDVNFYGVGGDELLSHGVELVYHLKDFSSMGFSEVLEKLPFYFKAMNEIRAEVEKRETRTAILVDFQDFNLRLAKKLKKVGVKVLYYVAPQAWAWKPQRSEVLSKTVHTLFTILPFEKQWFMERGVKQVRGVPHPLLLTYKSELNNVSGHNFGEWSDKVKLLLLPGSRGAEIRGLLPRFIETVKELRKSHKIEVHLVKVEHVDQSLYEYFLPDIDIVHKSQDLTRAMRECHFALAASGTVTLSTGLFALPTVVCYQSSLLNEFIYYNFIKYNGPISLTNIVHNRMVFPEFVQDSVNAQQLARVIKTWMSDESIYNELKAILQKTTQLMSGEGGSVSEYMAQVINE